MQANFELQQGRIDCHAHFLTPAYRQLAQQAFPDGPDGFPGFPQWSPQLALEQMDAVGIAAAVLSVSSPGVHFGDDAAAGRLAREVNEAGARLVRDHPRRFGLFASLPLPDVTASLVEMTYAFEQLRADGVVMLTNARGMYPGDARMQPLLAELDQRSAAVFLHPTSPFCPVCHGGGLDYPRPMLEFMFETTRAVTDLILTGTLRQFPHIRWIVPHAGAALPVLAARIGGVAAALRPGSGSPQEVADQLRRMYFDLAGFPVPTLLRALQDIADPQRVLYGSDWPFTPLAATQQLARELDLTDLLDNSSRAAVYRDNALRLLPALAARIG